MLIDITTETMAHPLLTVRSVGSLVLQLITANYVFKRQEHDGSKSSESHYFSHDQAASSD